MKRFGPLELPANALVLGDSAGSHVELTPAALVLRRFEADARHIPWTDVTSATLRVAETRFRWPGLATTVVIGLLAGIAGDWGLGSDEPDEGEITIALRDGSVLTAPLTRHHVGGYWVRTVRAASALLRRMVDDPASRSLLATPERLIDLLARRQNGLS
ncbi:hypothetical protein [Planctomonas psychrotolerans]|uniref:hypothetical protein n=1 Tax=Planctomonas psychrotolerans TaxID=2528712 RepID=UPI0012386A71|nr:hypothetical protein [Planctomonas psychrotolerans]